MEMDEQFKKIMNEHLRLARENNEMLRAMRRESRFGKLVKFLKYAIIIALLIGAWYYLKPYIDQVRTTYQEAKNSVDSLKEVGENVSGMFPGQGQ